MTTPVAWHATLPQRPNATPFEDQMQLNSELFQPDNKVTRGRRIAEELPDLLRWAFDMDRAQYEAFKAFFKTDLKGGFVPVTFTDPVSEDPRDLLIIGNPQTERLAPQLWRVTLDLEEL